MQQFYGWIFPSGVAIQAGLKRLRVPSPAAVHYQGGAELTAALTECLLASNYFQLFTMLFPIFSLHFHLKDIIQIAEDTRNNGRITIAARKQIALKTHGNPMMEAASTPAVQGNKPGPLAAIKETNENFINMDLEETARGVTTVLKARPTLSLCLSTTVSLFSMTLFALAMFANHDGWSTCDLNDPHWR